MNLGAAIGLFTVLPARARKIDRMVAGQAIKAIPVVGLVLGLLAGSVGMIAFYFGTPMIGAVLVLATLALATGAMHLDGLADTADGLGSRKPAKEALSIMRKSDVGPMGVSALVLTLLVQLTSLASAPNLWVLLGWVIGGTIVSRAVCLVASTRIFPSARVSGFGSLFWNTVSPTNAIVISAITILIACILGQLLGIGVNLSAFAAQWSVFRSYLIAGLSCFAAGLLTARLFVHKLGGMTGDTFGAVIEITTATWWLTIALVW